MHELLELIAYRANNFRMAMPDVVDRNPTREINKAPSLDIPQFGILGTRHIKIAHHSKAARRSLLAAGLESTIG